MFKTIKKCFGEVGGMFKIFLSNTADFTGKYSGYNAYMKIKGFDSLSQQYTDNVHKLTESQSNCSDLEEKLEFLEGFALRLGEDKQSVEKELADYKQGILDSFEYKMLEQEKNKYEKQAEDRGKLVDHLKEGKKGLIAFSNQIIDKIPETIMDFLKNDKHYSKQSMFFVNSKGIIVGYTEAFKEKLKMSGDFLGQNAYECLSQRYPNLQRLGNIKNFFNTYDERIFDIEFDDNGDKIKLHFTKEHPVMLKRLDLRPLGKNKIIDTIAFIPIYVKPIGKIMSKFHSHQSLDAQIKAHEEERKGTYHGLVTKHGWTNPMIIERENEVGYEELREEYLDLEKELKEKIKRNKKK